METEQIKTKTTKTQWDSVAHGSICGADTIFYFGTDNYPLTDGAILFSLFCDLSSVVSTAGKQPKNGTEVRKHQMLSNRVMQFHSVLFVLTDPTQLLNNNLNTCSLFKCEQHLWGSDEESAQKAPGCYDLRLNSDHIWNKKQV